MSHFNLRVSSADPTDRLDVLCVSPANTTNGTFCNGSPDVSRSGNDFNITLMAGTCWGQEAKTITMPSNSPIPLLKFKSDNSLTILWNGSTLRELSIWCWPSSFVSSETTMFFGTVDCATRVSVGNEINLAYAPSLFDKFGNRMIVTASTAAAFTTSLARQPTDITVSNLSYRTLSNWGVAILGDLHASGQYDLRIWHQVEPMQVATTAG